MIKIALLCGLVTLIMFGSARLAVGREDGPAPAGESPSDEAETVEALPPAEVRLSGEKTVVERYGCTVEQFSLYSPANERDIRVVVVLPPAYAEQPDARFPVLHTLHGMGAPYDTWSQMGPLLRSLGERPMILTCFDGDRAGWYIDATEKPGSMFATWFTDEFGPWIDATYRTIGDGRYRAVTGFSMGGYGAMQYMLTDPRAFSAASALSGAFFRFGETGKPPHNGLDELLGPFEENREAYLRYGIKNRIESYVAAGVGLPPLYMHCGTEDGLLEENRAFVNLLIAQNAAIRKRLSPQVAEIEDRRERRRKLAELMDARGIDFRYVESPGGHNWSFWRDASEDVARFHWNVFRANAAEDGKRLPEGEK